jgi:hypothetical protein
MGTTTFADNNALSFATAEEARLWVDREAPAIHPAFGTKSCPPDADWTPIQCVTIFFVISQLRLC